MSKPVKVEIKQHRVGITAEGGTFEWGVGDVVELAADEAERMIKAGAAKAVKESK